MENLQGVLPDLSQIQDVQPGSQMDQFFEQYNAKMYQANTQQNYNQMNNEYLNYFNAIRDFQQRRMAETNNIQSFNNMFQTEKQQTAQLITNSLVGITNKYLWMATNKDSIALTNLRNMLQRPYGVTGVDKTQVRQRQLKFLQKMQGARDQAQQYANQVINNQNFTDNELNVLNEISRIHGRQMAKIQSSTDNIRLLNFIQDSSTASFFAAKSIRDSVDSGVLEGIVKKFLMINPENLKQLSDQKGVFNKSFGKIIADEMDEIRFNPRQSQEPLKLQDFINQTTFLDQVAENDFINPAAVHNILQANKNYVPSTKQVIRVGQTAEETKQNIYNQFNVIVQSSSDEQMGKFIKKFEEEPVKYAMPIVTEQQKMDNKVYETVFDAVAQSRKATKARVREVAVKLDDEQREFFNVYFHIDEDTGKINLNNEELSKKIVDLVVDQTDYYEAYQSKKSRGERPTGILQEFWRIRQKNLQGPTIDLPVLASGVIATTQEQVQRYNLERQMDQTIAQGLRDARIAKTQNDNGKLQKALISVTNVYFEKNPIQQQQSYFNSIQDYYTAVKSVQEQQIQPYSEQMDWEEYQPVEEQPFEEEKVAPVQQVNRQEISLLNQNIQDTHQLFNEMVDIKKNVMGMYEHIQKLGKKQEKYKGKIENIQGRQPINIDQPITVSPGEINVAPPSITINNQGPPAQASEKVIIKNKIPNINLESTKSQIQMLQNELQGFSQYFRSSMDDFNRAAQKMNDQDMRVVQNLNQQIQESLQRVEQANSKKDLSVNVGQMNNLLNQMQSKFADWDKSQSNVDMRMREGMEIQRFNFDDLQRNKQSIQEATLDMKQTYAQIRKDNEDLQQKFKREQNMMEDFLKKINNRSLQSATEFIRQNEQKVNDMGQDYLQIYDDTSRARLKFENMVVGSDEQVRMINLTSKKLESMGQKALSIEQNLKGTFRKIQDENAMREGDDIIDVFPYETLIYKANHDLNEIRNDANMSIQMANILADPNVAIQNSKQAQSILNQAQNDIQKTIAMRQRIDDRIKKGQSISQEEREDYVQQYTITATKVIAGQGFKGIYNTIGGGVALDELQKELTILAQQSNSEEYGKIVELLEDQKMFRTGLGQQMESGEYMQILKGLPKEYIDEDLKLRHNKGTDQRNVRIAAEMVGQLLKLSPEALQNEEMKQKSLEGDAFQDFMRAVLQSDDKIEFMNKIEKILLEQGKIPTEAVLAKITGKYVRELRDETLEMFKQNVDMDLHKAYGSMNPADGILMMMKGGRLPADMRNKLRLNLNPDQALLVEKEEIYSNNVEHNINLMNELLNAQDAEERKQIKFHARIRRENDEENINSIYGLGRILQGATTLEGVQEARRLRQEHQKQFYADPVVKGELFSQEQANNIIDKMTRDLAV